MTASWGEAPPILPAKCDKPDCPGCQTTEAGARELTRRAGIDYDALDEHAQRHYGYIAGEVFAAMSARLLELGAVKEKEGPADAGRDS